MPILASMIALSCGGQPLHSKSTMPLAQNEQPRYITPQKLKTLLADNTDTVIVFSADWCSACNLTRTSLSKAKLRIKVHYLNVSEPWVAKLAMMMGIKSIPIMFHTGMDGKTREVRSGPRGIVSYLVFRY